MTSQRPAARVLRGQGLFFGKFGRAGIHFLGSRFFASSNLETGWNKPHFFGKSFEHEAASDPISC